MLQLIGLLVILLTVMLCQLPPPLCYHSLQKLRGSTGFSPVEVFRKYLWFLLRERQFDVAAVEDMVLLKQGLGLTDEQVCVLLFACLSSGRMHTDWEVLFVLPGAVF